jgi:hypothetical protein
MHSACSGIPNVARASWKIIVILHHATGGVFLQACPFFDQVFGDFIAVQATTLKYIFDRHQEFCALKLLRVKGVNIVLSNG